MVLLIGKLNVVVVKIVVLCPEYIKLFLNTGICQIHMEGYL